MTEPTNTPGTRGLEYGTKVAVEMIADRVRQLEDKGTVGMPTDRRAAINQLVQEGNLKTLGEVSNTDRYLGDPARRETKAGQRRQAQQGQDQLKRDRAEAKERGISLSVLMNERAMKGEVKL